MPVYTRPEHGIALDRNMYFQALQTQNHRDHPIPKSQLSLAISSASLALVEPFIFPQFIIVMCFIHCQRLIHCRCASIFTFDFCSVFYYTSTLLQFLLQFASPYLLTHISLLLRFLTLATIISVGCTSPLQLRTFLIALHSPVLAASFLSVLICKPSSAASFQAPLFYLQRQHRYPTPSLQFLTASPKPFSNLLESADFSLLDQEASPQPAKLDPSSLFGVVIVD